MVNDLEFNNAISAIVYKGSLIRVNSQAVRPTAGVYNHNVF